MNHVILEKRSFKNSNQIILQKKGYSKKLSERCGDSTYISGTRSESNLMYNQPLNSDYKEYVKRPSNNYSNQKRDGQMGMSAGGETANTLNISKYGFPPKLIKKLNCQLETALTNKSKIIKKCGK